MLAVNLLWARFRPERNFDILQIRSSGGVMRQAQQSLTYAVSLIISTLLIGTLPQPLSAKSDAETGPGTGRIAYINQVGDLYTIKPDGTDRRQLASGELLQTVALQPIQSSHRSSYSWPVWSPDGSRLACFRTVANEDGQSGELYVFDVSTSQILNVYKEPGLQPIYAYWAPDGKHLAVLRNRAQTLSLDLWPTTGWRPPSKLAEGMPFYFDWRADAQALLVHNGGDSQATSGYSISLVTVPSGQRQILSQTPAAFGAPSWSFDNQWLAYGDNTRAAPHVSLLIAPANGSEPQSYAVVSQRIAFSWSPTKLLVAFATTSHFDGSVFEELSLIDVSSGNRRTLVKDLFAAYFWSPNGKRILYARRIPGTGSGTWVMVDVASGEKADIVNFTPSGPLIQVFRYFDQYALSHRLWAPDSQHFVFSGSTDTEAHPLTALRSPDVYVLEAKAGATPHRLADGHIGFWSPR